MTLAKNDSWYGIPEFLTLLWVSNGPDRPGGIALNPRQDKQVRVLAPVSHVSQMLGIIEDTLEVESHYLGSPDLLPPPAFWLLRGLGLVTSLLAS